MFRIIVETYGEIPNQNIHVSQPLARIVAQSFDFHLRRPHPRITPDAVTVAFENNKVLEPGTLVAITVQTTYDPSDVPNAAAFQTLQTAIASAIDQSGMFRCRETHGLVRLEIQLGTRLAFPQAA
jgi:hypothetical protein